MSQPGTSELIVGREAERSLLSSFLDRLQHEPSILLIEGEPGIGKTILWAEAVGEARSRGCRVLATSPTEAESRLPFVGFGDLMEGIPESLLDELPRPQRRSLDIALLRREPRGPPLDLRAISVAFLSILRSLAREGALVLAIDDLQWLDRSSTRVLDFCLRRLGGEGLGVLATRRSGATEGPRLGGGWPESRIQTLLIGPMGKDELSRILRSRLGTGFSPPVLDRLYGVSGGNAFFALELARAAIRGDERATGQTLPIPRNLKEDVLRARFGALPARAQDVLVAASAAARPRISLLQGVVGGPSIDRPLARAREAGLVEIDGDEVRFTHPLYGSAVYADASRARRRRVHRRLAELVTDPDERARHMALGAEGPDPEAASALEAAAEHAVVRGDPAAAAELAELALRLTSADDSDGALARRLLAAQYHHLSGHAQGAIDQLEAAIADAKAGAGRAGAIARLVAITGAGDTQRAVPLLTEAIAQPDLPPDVQSALHREMARARWYLGEGGPAEEHAATAMRLARHGDDARLQMEVLAMVLLLDRAAGRDVDSKTLRRGHHLEGVAGSVAVTARPSFVEAVASMWRDELGGSRKQLLALLDEARDEGDEHSTTVILWHLGELERRAGRWVEARSHLTEAEGSGSLAAVTAARLIPYRMLMDVSVGRIDEARAEAEAAAEAATGVKDAFALVMALSVLGFSELTGGDAAAAHEHLARAWELLDRWGIQEPGIFHFVPDAVEASIAAGETRQARALLRWLAERGASLDRPWATATAARCRGLLATAEGHGPAVLRALGEAMRAHENLPMPFERARTLVALGAARRRGGQKRGAREALEEAVSIFDDLGATPWAGKARTELARIGGRRPSGQDLTGTEERVARLAAAGRTNREIADTLFLSVRTVEAHLSHIYGKLGIRSRTELALFLTAEESHS
jgi:DNA-binding CsgD family transcriptional regulator/tetratricopeptide (TPR) repeat protein